MNQSIILDHEGALNSMAGHRVIETEIDFLRFADSDESLLIRGRVSVYVGLCVLQGARSRFRGTPLSRC